MMAHLALLNFYSSQNKMLLQLSFIEYSLSILVFHRIKQAVWNWITRSKKKSGIIANWKKVIPQQSKIKKDKRRNAQWRSNFRFIYASIFTKPSADVSPVANAVASKHDFAASVTKFRNW